MKYIIYKQFSDYLNKQQIDLGSIKDKYEELFEMELWQAIDDECSSDFKRLLLNIIHDS